MRKVPMIKSNPWLDTSLETGINQPVIKIQSFIIDLACAARQNAGPGKRKSKIRNEQQLHQVEVSQVMLIKIACIPAMMVIPYILSLTCKMIPDRRALSILIVSSFYLVRRGRNS